MEPPSSDRRTVMAGLAACAIPLVPKRSDPSPDDPAPAVRLVENLVTRIGAEVELNRSHRAVFVIDTGAVQTAIADSLLNPLGLTPQRVVRVHGITATEIAPAVDISLLNLAGERFRDLKCPVLPRALLGADGLLGLDVLSRFKLRFNIQGRAAALTVPGRGEINFGSEATASRLSQEGSPLSRGALGQMLINQVATDSVAAVALIDSGAQYSIGNLALRRAVVSRADTTTRGQEITLYGVTGQELAAELRSVNDLRIGTRRLGAMPLLFADLHCFSVLGLSQRPALLIGADLLGRFRDVAIDFPRQRIVFGDLQRSSPRTLRPLLG